MLLLNTSLHFEYMPLLIITAIAWAAPLLLSLFKLKKIPTVLIEIVLGFVVARYFFTDISASSLQIADFLAQVGLIFLMFLSGLEIDMDQITASFPRKKPRLSGVIANPLLIGLLYFIATLLFANVGAFGLSFLIDIPNIWYFALIMVATSLGIVMPVLKERGEIHSRYGQMIIIAASISDFFGIVLFTFTAIILKGGLQFELFLIFGIFILFYVFYKFGQRAQKIKIIRKLVYQLSHAAAQIQVRGSILLILVFVVVSQFIGDEVVYLGAFLSGLFLSTLLHKERSIIQIKLDGMGFGFFIPFFFIMIGARFDPTAFKNFDASMIWFMVALLISLYALNVLPAIYWRRLFGVRRALAGGFLMGSRLSLVIVASAIGMSLGVISEEINAAFIVLAVITCFLSPYLFGLIATDSSTEGNKTIVVGGSSTGVLIARRMHLLGKKAVIIEKDPARAKEIISKGIRCEIADGKRIKTFGDLHMTAADFVVINTASSSTNHFIAKLLREDLRHENLISWSSSKEISIKMKALGVTTLDVQGIFATTIENLILRPNTYHALIETFENFSVEEVMISNPSIDGMQVKDIGFHTNAILMMVKREQSFSIPHGDTYFSIGDILHVFGTQTALEDTRKKLSK